MQLEVVRERTRERETRPGWWVEALRHEAAQRQKRARPISQMKLATLAGRHVSAVSRWEAEDGEIDFLSWVGLLTILGISADWEPREKPAAPAPRARVKAKAR